MRYIKDPEVTKKHKSSRATTVQQLLPRNKQLDKPRYVNLTKREQDCCYRLIFGYSASQIAKELNISVRTVEHYISSLKLKLRCANKYNLSEQLRKKLRVSIKAIIDQIIND